MINPYRRTANKSLASKPRMVLSKKAPTSRREEAVRDQDGNYNPHSYGHLRADLKRAVSNPKSRLFNDKGELNAQDHKDALRQIAHLMNTTKTASPASFRKEAGISSEDRGRILTAAMSDPTGEGFAIVGQELLLPIKDVIDYEGWARKIVRVRPLAQGQPFRIARDVKVVAWVVGQDGQGVESRVFGRYVMPPEFKISAFMTVDVADIYQMNYDVIDRSQDLARQDIERKEDIALRNALAAASQTVNSTTFFGPTLGISAFESIRYEIERHRLVVEKFIINRRELSDLVQLSPTEIDLVTQRELLLAGYIGNVLNAQIITSAGTGVQEVVAPGTVYAVTGGDNLGEMGVRLDLYSEPYNLFVKNQFVKGWAFVEIVGFVIVNPRAVAMGQKI